jgi:hypothetical protein
MLSARLSLAKDRLNFAATGETQNSETRQFGIPNLNALVATFELAEE